MDANKTLQELQALLDYGNLTFAGQATIRSAKDLIMQEIREEHVKAICTEIDSLFGNLVEKGCDTLKAWREQQEQLTGKAPRNCGMCDECEGECYGEAWPVVITEEDIRNGNYPQVVWRETRGLETTIPQEILGIGNEPRDPLLRDKPIELIEFADGGDMMELYGDSYRFWTVKPTAEDMKSTPWLRELKSEE